MPMTTEQEHYALEIADHEITRTHALRTVNNANLLLADAIAAVGNGDMHVVLDHLQRVHNSLNLEAGWLRSRA